MISITISSRKFFLVWVKGTWRDQAGCIWNFQAKEGIFHCARHGQARLNEWESIEPNQGDTKPSTPC